MRNLRSTLLPLVLAALAGGVSAATPTYSVVDRFAGGDGGYDYVSFDSTSRQVFVGRSTGVMKIDLASRKVTNDFVKGETVAAVLLISGTPLMLSTNEDGNTATLFDRTTGVVKARIPTGKGPDAALYDANSKLVFVMNGDSEDVTLIDVVRAAPVGTIPLGGKPEAAASDEKGRVYINIEDTAQIAVVDVAARKVVGKYKLAGCDEPTGLAFDKQTGLLISACHNNIAKVIDAATGADKATVTIAQGADGAIVDAQRRLVYVPCNEGVLSIFPLSEAGVAGRAQAVPTQRFARTAALDAQSGRLYLPTNRRTKGTDGKWQVVPGSFEVLVVAPK